MCVCMYRNQRLHPSPHACARAEPEPAQYYEPVYKQALHAKPTNKHKLAQEQASRPTQIHTMKREDKPKPTRDLEPAHETQCISK